MGEVAVQIKVMPQSPEVDLEQLKRKIELALPNNARLYSFDIQPIAFGLKALLVTVIVGDVEGGTDSTEEALSRVDGVESIQVVTATRML
ncbi:MAG: elongation factor 1-beta [Halobacteriota archaeon]